ncbi:MAG: glycine cleavage system protein H [Bacteroidales bacterium]|nr:glycine cleavage system protein H [Bacteroidales bacterium]
MTSSLVQKRLPACLWMQAGVVAKKHCPHNFDCTGCRFNKAMNRVCMKNEELRHKRLPLTGKKATFEFWMDRLRKMPAAKRPCIHSMKGRIDYKNCPKSYHCNDCEFDLYFHDQFRVHTVMQPIGFDDIHGVSMPTGYYLHPGHTWIKIEEQGVVRIGVDDFAARLFGNFDHIKAPLTGKELTQDQPMISLSRNDNEVRFIAPVSGVVMEVNTALNQNPELITQSPYTDGWIFMIYCPNLKLELKKLMFMNSCNAFINTEVDRLYDFIEEETQLKAADGGHLVSDIHANLPTVPWEHLVKKFIPQGV